MKNGIRIGDLVVLRSGGPRLTVLEIDAAANTLRCAWFDDRGDFDDVWLPADAVRTLESAS